MSATAIILARAGSKGLPAKNRRPIASKPCALWTIEHALASRTISRVILTTDDTQLIDTCRALAPPTAKPIEYLHRPAHLAQDNTPIDEAARHAATECALDPAHPIAILYANCPVRPADLTDRAIARLTESRCDSVQSYSAVAKHHPLWTCRVDESGSVADSGKVTPWQGDTRFNNIFRRQDLPPAYIPDGGVIALTHASLMRELPDVPDSPHAFLGTDHRAITTSPGDVIDIDNEIDALVAEQILESRSKNLARA